MVLELKKTQHDLRLGTDVYLGLYVHALGARKISHCLLLHAHWCHTNVAAVLQRLRVWLQLQRLSPRAQAITGPIGHIRSVLCLIFCHLVASHNGSPVTAVFNGIQRPMSVITEWAL